ncbi:hypothetical protein VP01_4730g1 [Puccinia sorghi]|uniref:Uncharacterized protein n=1 Tax=Puccinia sorghi TaxID=27349 RepID=A0A0L6UNR7_9BASI|nr:hypothetical protein VP01_4730g1 [Puccinia sorghi]
MALVVIVSTKYYAEKKTCGACCMSTADTPKPIRLAQHTLKARVISNFESKKIQMPEFFSAILIPGMIPPVQMPCSFRFRIYHSENLLSQFGCHNWGIYVMIIMIHKEESPSFSFQVYIKCVDMQKVQQSCWFYYLSPRLIQPSFDAQSMCRLHSDCAKTSTNANRWSLDRSLAGAGCISTAGKWSCPGQLCQNSGLSALSGSNPHLILHSLQILPLHCYDLVTPSGTCQGFPQLLALYYLNHNILLTLKKKFNHPQIIKVPSKSRSRCQPQPTYHCHCPPPLSLFPLNHPLPTGRPLLATLTTADASLTASPPLFYPLTAGNFPTAFPTSYCSQSITDYRLPLFVESSVAQLRRGVGVMDNCTTEDYPTEARPERKRSRMKHPECGHSILNITS